MSAEYKMEGEPIVTAEPAGADRFILRFSAGGHLFLTFVRLDEEAKRISLTLEYLSEFCKNAIMEFSKKASVDFKTEAGEWTGPPGKKGEGPSKGNC